MTGVYPVNVLANPGTRSNTFQRSIYGRYFTSLSDTWSYVDEEHR